MVKQVLAQDDRAPAIGDGGVRASLVSWLGARAKTQHRLIHEFWVPLSHERADVVEVNGLLCGFEIKSARDHLKRLDRQVGAFNRLFDQITLVADRRHMAFLSGLPAWWGLLEAQPSREGVELVLVRTPSPNPKRELAVQIRLLWKSELAGALGDIGVTPDRHATRAGMQEQLLQAADHEQLEAIIRAKLLARDPATARW